MNVPSTEELLMLLGLKETEIYSLLLQVRSLTAQVEELQSKAKSTAPLPATE